MCLTFELPTINICFLQSALPLYCQVYVYTVCSPISATLYFKVLQIINSQNINSPSGAICTVFDNFFLRLIRIMKFSRINTLYLFMFLTTNNCAVTSLELLIVMNINLNGNGLISSSMKNLFKQIFRKLSVRTYNSSIFS